MTPAHARYAENMLFPLLGQLEDVRLGSSGAFRRPAYLACELCVCLMEIYRIVFCIVVDSQGRHLYRMFVTTTCFCTK